MDYTIAIYYRGYTGYSDANLTYSAGSADYAKYLYDKLCDKYTNEYNPTIYHYTKTDTKFAIYDKFNYEIMKIIVESSDELYKNWNW